LRVAVVGGGAGGCELALAIHSRLIRELESRNLSVASLEMTILHKGTHLMPQHNKGVRTIVLRLLTERGIVIHLNTNVVSVRRGTAAGASSEEGGEGGVIVCEDGKEIEYDEAIWCTQVRFLIHCCSTESITGRATRLVETDQPRPHE
jgi:NADH dehydrogenase FAD-containing subunit